MGARNAKPAPAASLRRLARAAALSSDGARPSTRTRVPTKPMRARSSPDAAATTPSTASAKPSGAPAAMRWRSSTNASNARSAAATVRLRTVSDGTKPDRTVRSFARVSDHV